MKVEQIYTGCLAEAAYYIESKGEAAIIDPLRETKPYMDKANRRGARIKYILETHFHADFVSGHIDLAKKTGATIVFGPTASPAYEAHIATDGEILKLGDVQIKVLHTPGHTMESTTYLLIDENGQMHCLFTGDTLFIGDVGRPDLVQKVKKEITPEILAGYLYDSLRNKIMPLPDDLIVYPGHGAGSACGKNMSRETTDTLGHQKQTNYALRPELTKEGGTTAIFSIQCADECAGRYGGDRCHHPEGDQTLILSRIQSGTRGGGRCDGARYAQQGSLCSGSYTRQHIHRDRRYLCALGRHANQRAEAAHTVHR